jgi:hypothetical protein
MECVEVSTVEEFNAAVAGGKLVHVRTGEWEASGSAQVTASGSAQVRASGPAQVTASGSAQVRATKYVAITIHGGAVLAEGGVHIRIPCFATAAEWCEFYGLPVVDGVVTLFKTVRENFKSTHGVLYAPGTTPEAADWDGGEAECGGGLHFSPRPFMALRFDSAGKRFVACPVRLSDIRAPQADDMYPEKVKARAVCAPIYEVDQDGNRLEVK